MEVRKPFLLILLVFGLCSVLRAHQDFVKVVNFGKVTVRIRSGAHYPEVTRAEAVGKVVENYLKKYMRVESFPVLLDFVHLYTNPEAESHTFVSFNRGELGRADGSDLEPPLEEEGMVIRYFGPTFDVERVLAVLEFALVNRNGLMRSSVKHDFAGYSFECVKPGDLDPLLEGVKPSIGMQRALDREIEVDGTDGPLKGLDLRYQHPEFVFYPENAPDSLRISDLSFFHVSHPDYGLVFTEPSGFVVLDLKTGITGQLHRIPGGRAFDWMPVTILREKKNFVEIAWEKKGSRGNEGQSNSESSRNSRRRGKVFFEKDYFRVK